MIYFNIKSIVFNLNVKIVYNKGNSNEFNLLFRLYF